MKRKYIFLFLSIFALGALFMQGCSEDEYDFDKIIPAILGHDVADEAMLGRVYLMDVSDRTGSTYAWTVTGDAELIDIRTGEPGAGYEFRKYLYVTGSTNDIVVSVTETTSAGKVSETVVDSLYAADVEDFYTEGIDGPAIGIVGNTSTYEVELYNNQDKYFSSFEWSFEAFSGAATATVNTDEPWTYDMLFTEAGDFEIQAIETSNGGLKDTVDYDVTAIVFCGLDDFGDIEGTYAGTDVVVAAWYGSNSDNNNMTVAIKAGRTVTITGGFWYATYGPSYWGESVTGGDVVEVTLNTDGTIDFKNQYGCQTDDEWDYYVGPWGAGYWTACDDMVEIFVPYKMWWDDAYSSLGGYAYLTMTMDLTPMKRTIDRDFSKNIRMKDVNFESYK